MHVLWNYSQGQGRGKCRVPGPYFFVCVREGCENGKVVIVGDLTLSLAVFRGETGLVEVELKTFAD